jgi:hypothetical protein
MKKIYIALLTTALLGMGSVAIAGEPVTGPVILSDKQMQQIVAGGSDLSGGCATPAIRCDVIIELNPNIIDLYGGSDNMGVDEFQGELRVGSAAPVGRKFGASFDPVP